MESRLLKKFKFPLPSFKEEWFPPYWLRLHAVQPQTPPKPPTRLEGFPLPTDGFTIFGRII